MKVIEDAFYKEDFPELFNWGALDSIKLSDVAEKLVADIHIDLNTRTRNFVPGLRMALNEIAKLADLF